MHAKLSPSEEARINRKPTENGEAYLAFVQAHNLHLQLEELPKLRQAQQLYERALELDPNFALAAAQLSKLHSWIYHTYEPTPEHRQKSRSLAERALQLQPDLPEAHFALGFSFYYLDLDYARAGHEFAIAQKGLPNDSDIYLAIGAILRRQGKWDESSANLEKAVNLSPNETWPLQNLVLNYQMERNWPLANKTVDRALKLAPDSLNFRAIKSQLEMSEKGSFQYVDEGIRIMDAKPMSEIERAHFTLSCMQVLLLERKFDEVIRRGATLKDDLLASDTEKLLGKYGMIGIAKKVTGDEAGARETLLKAKEIGQRYLSEAPEDFKRHSRLAEVLAWLGEKDAAIAEAKRARELLPESVDAFDGPGATQTLAEIYITVGEYDLAFPLLDGLLSRPSPLTVEFLKIHPVYDAIRNDPRFMALLKKHGG